MKKIFKRLSVAVLASVVLFGFLACPQLQKAKSPKNAPAPKLDGCSLKFTKDGKDADGIRCFKDKDDSVILEIVEKPGESFAPYEVKLHAGYGSNFEKIVQIVPEGDANTTTKFKISIPGSANNYLTLNGKNSKEINFRVKSQKERRFHLFGKLQFFSHRPIGFRDDLSEEEKNKLEAMFKLYKAKDDDYYRLEKEYALGLSTLQEFLKADSGTPDMTLIRKLDIQIYDSSGKQIYGLMNDNLDSRIIQYNVSTLHIDCWDKVKDGEKCEVRFGGENEYNGVKTFSHPIYFYRNPAKLVGKVKIPPKATFQNSEYEIGDSLNISARGISPGKDIGLQADWFYNKFDFYYIDGQEVLPTPISKCFQEADLEYRFLFKDETNWGWGTKTRKIDWDKNFNTKPVVISDKADPKTYADISKWRLCAIDPKTEKPIISEGVPLEPFGIKYEKGIFIEKGNFNIITNSNGDLRCYGDLGYGGSGFYFYVNIKDIIAPDPNSFTWKYTDTTPAGLNDDKCVVEKTIKQVTEADGRIKITFATSSNNPLGDSATGYFIFSYPGMEDKKLLLSSN